MDGGESKIRKAIQTRKKRKGLDMDVEETNPSVGWTAWMVTDTTYEDGKN